MGGGGSRGTDVFAAYTAHGDTTGETWHPELNHFGMQWLQVTGLPDGYEPGAETVTGLQLHAAAPAAGGLHTSDDRINRIHRLELPSRTPNAPASSLPWSNVTTIPEERDVRNSVSDTAGPGRVGVDAEERDLPADRPGPAGRHGRRTRPQGQPGSQDAPAGADFQRVEADRALYEVTSGTCRSTARGVRPGTTAHGRRAEL